MNPEPTLIHSRSTPSSAEAALLEAAWSSRSPEELRQLIEHGLRDGDSVAAARELERRARDGTTQAEQAVEVDKAHHRTFVRYLVSGLIAVAIVGLFVGLFVA